MKGPTRISRRAVLRGVGAAVSLPLLEAMNPGRAGAAGAPPPLCPAFLYVPNGVHMPDWTPKEVGTGFALPPVLEPLRGVRDDLLVLSGLTLDPARAHGDGGGDHARTMSSFLTGRHPRKSDGADLRAGISIDQVAARVVGRSTRLPSLEIGCEGGRNAGECDHGYSCAYQSNLSWRSESTPVAKEFNPRLVFDRLFGGTAGCDEARPRGGRHRKSIVDQVLEDARQLAATLGNNDCRNSTNTSPACGMSSSGSIGTRRSPVPGGNHARDRSASRPTTGST